MTVRTLTTRRAIHTSPDTANSAAGNHERERSGWVDAHHLIADEPDSVTTVGRSLSSFLPSLPSWFDDAACAGEPVEAFVPDRGRPDSHTLETCEGCAVRDECLDYALSQPAWLDGVWGGTTPSRRIVLRRERRLMSDPTRTLHGTAPADAQERKQAAQ